MKNIKAVIRRFWPYYLIVSFFNLWMSYNVIPISMTLCNWYINIPAITSQGQIANNKLVGIY